MTDDIFTALPPAPYQSARYAVGAAPATRLLWDGDVVDLGDRHFEVIHTPGHSPGGIALWEAATGILIAGDIVYDGELIEGTSAQEQSSMWPRCGGFWRCRCGWCMRGISPAIRASGTARSSPTGCARRGPSSRFGRRFGGRIGG